MNILLTPFNWFTCGTSGGGEYYLSRIIEQLKTYGHNFKGIAYCDKPFTHNGIEFVQQGGMETVFTSNNDLVEWSDVIFHQLLGNAYGYNKAQQHKKPNILFAHNTSRHYFTDNSTRVVYNSQTLADMKLFDRDSFVQLPLVPKVTPYPIEQRKYIALINCNLNKGAKLFNELAETLPYPFLGIKGAYGEQILSNAVNYVEHSEAVNWSEIKLLLVPSETESWSQVASEAISHGIPVICSPLAGVKENLSYSGIYIEKENISLYKEMIYWLMESDSTYLKQSELCLKRAGEYNNCLDKFNEWLINV